MLILKINIDYKRKVEDREKISDRALTADYINYATKKKFPQGLDKAQLKIFGRIQDKLDDAIFENEDFIQLEQAEVDLLKEVFKGDITFPSDVAKYVLKLLDVLDDFFLEAKEAKKKK